MGVEFVDYEDSPAAEKEFEPPSGVTGLVEEAFDPETGAYVPEEERFSSADLDWDPDPDADEDEGGDELAPAADWTFSQVQDVFQQMTQGQRLDFLAGLSEEQRQELTQAHARERVESQLEEVESFHERREMWQQQREWQAEQQQQQLELDAGALIYSEIERETKAAGSQADPMEVATRAGNVLHGELADKWRAQGHDEETIAANLLQPETRQWAYKEAIEQLRVEAVTRMKLGEGPFDGSWVRR